MTVFISTLESLGYTEREASFLYLVAAHSGYFLRRQFNYFIDRQKGSIAHRFLEKAHEAGHIETIEYGHGTHVYHLFSKPLYRLLGSPDSQNRRRKGDGMVRTRLMVLDYVLENESDHYLVTAEERDRFFHGTRGIPLTDTPTAALFTSILPIAIADKDHPSSSLVRFVFIDEGLLSTGKFKRFLTEMAPLFHALRTFELIYVACSDCNFVDAEREFRRQFSPIVPTEQRTFRPDWNVETTKRRPSLNAWFTTVLFEHPYAANQRNESLGLRSGRRMGPDEDSQPLISSVDTSKAGLLRG